MLLAIDIGNTNVVLALLDAEDRVLEERRAPSKDGWTAEQYAAQIRALLCGRAVRGAAVSSVVPELTGGLGRFVVPHCRRRLVYDEHLLLRGLGMIWRRAQGEIHSCGAMGNAV